MWGRRWPREGVYSRGKLWVKGEETGDNRKIIPGEKRGKSQSLGRVLWVWPQCHTCACSCRQMLRCRWWACNKNLANPGHSHISPHDKSQASFRARLGHHILFIVSEVFTSSKLSQRLFCYLGYCSAPWGAATVSNHCTIPISPKEMSSSVLQPSLNLSAFYFAACFPQMARKTGCPAVVLWNWINERACKRQDSLLLNISRSLCQNSNEKEKKSTLFSVTLH